MDTGFRVVLMSDITASMTEACASIQEIIGQITTMLGMLDSKKSSVRVATIGDFCKGFPNWEQGGYTISDAGCSIEELDKYVNDFVKPVRISQSYYEAYKTGINKILREKEIPDLLIMVVDAEPHGEEKNDESVLEDKFLQKNSMISDWDVLCQYAKTKMRIVIVYIKAPKEEVHCDEPWLPLGDVVYIDHAEISNITNAIMHVFNSVYGFGDSKIDNKGFRCSEIAPIRKIDLTESIEKSDPKTIIRQFEKLIDEKHPDNSACITTNPVIGKYWHRVTSVFKYEPKYDKFRDRCKRLEEKLSQCVIKMNPVNKSLFAAWKEESFDQSDRIRNLISECHKETKGYLQLPAGFPRISFVDLKLITQTGKFSKLAEAIASIILVPEPNKEVKEYIPMSVSPQHLFMLICNLITPRYMFSKSESYIVACLATKNKYLQPIAIDYLTKAGNWVNWELDDTGRQKHNVFWTSDFMNVLKIIPDSLITEEVQNFRDRFLLASRIVKNHNSTLKIERDYDESQFHILPTWKRLCRHCGYMRCFTIFPGNSEFCGICYPTILSRTEKYRYGNPKVLKDSGNEKAKWVKCITCEGKYTAATGYMERPQSAQCHYCRYDSGRKSPTVDCSCCNKRFLNPGNSAFIAMNEFIKTTTDSKKAELVRNRLKKSEFICPICVSDGSARKIEANITIQELIEQVSGITEMLPVQPYHRLMNTSRPFWQRVLDVKVISEIPVIPVSQLSGSKIYNIYKVVNEALHTLSNDSGIVVCDLCILETPVQNMVKACGKCNNNICRKCSESWYSPKIGTLVNEGNCRCPFCKEIPKRSLLKNYEIGKVKNLFKTRLNKGITCDWDSKFYYGICGRCYTLQPAVEKSCAGTMPEVRNFICEGCSELHKAKSASDLDIRKCPRCSENIERSGGCNHITCRCGSHWCWHCGKEFPEATIYDHMTGCGGIFPDGVTE